jgi:hypothetical protein
MALRFSAHPENLATEALLYLLHSHPSCRDAFERWTQSFGAPVEPLHWRTQYSTESGGVPDLVGLDSAGELAVAVEAKFWASLTDHQPVTYLAKLRANPPGLLLFLGPAVRDGRLWGELLRRAAAAELLDAAAPTHTSARRIVLANGRVLGLATWTGVLAVLEDAAVQAADPIARNDIVQLAGLCTRMDTEAFLPLQSEELTGFNGRRVWQFCALVNRATEELAQTGLASLKSFEGTALGTSAGTLFWGRYMNLGGVRCLLRFAPLAWANDRDTPIWLQVGLRSVPTVPTIREWLLPLDIAEPDRVFSRDTFVDVAIDLPTGEDEGVVTAAIVEQVRLVAERLPQGGALDRPMV